jgi:Flp pilus assembly protein TadD
MKLAVLPFSAAQDTPPALGRQLASFLGETLRIATNIELQGVSFLTQVEQDGETRAAFVNLQDAMMEPDQMKDLFEQAEADLAIDGLLKIDGNDFDLKVRYHRAGGNFEEAEHKFVKADLFTTLRKLVYEFAKMGNLELPTTFDAELEFGTEDPDVFLDFMEGYDSITYIQQANGAVAREFSPEPAFAKLLSCVDRDADFMGPYQSAVQLGRLSAQYRIGTFELIDETFKKLVDAYPDEFPAIYASGELQQSVGNLVDASNLFERAVSLAPEEPSAYLSLGVVQGQLGMPVNAERNMKKALELDPDMVAAIANLSGILAQQGRPHEVPAIWKALVERHPSDPQALVNYAMSHIQAGNEADAERAFDEALEKAEDNTLVKRAYAPLLVQKGELDRAMDFYEDFLEVAPNQIDALLEYAQVLQQADREFEIPNVLKTVLGSNPDANTRAQALAWLIELEQPKRVESVQNAQQKMEAGDFDGAVRELRPMKNWLGDYWKMWALLGAGLNRLGESEEAEEASRILLGLFPGCEPAYGELMTALSAQGKNDEAYNMMRYAAANMPQSLGVHVNLGLAAKRSGKDEEARGLAKQIREVVGPNEELEPLLAEMEA